MDFDRLSPAAWGSVLIVRRISPLIQSGSSVPVSKRAQTLAAAEVGARGQSLYASAPGE